MNHRALAQIEEVFAQSAVAGRTHTTVSLWHRSAPGHARSTRTTAHVRGVQASRWQGRDAQLPGIDREGQLLSQRGPRASAALWTGDPASLPGIIGLTHKNGCARGREGITVLQRVLAGMATHPNVGAYLLVGLGSETKKEAA